MSSLEIGRYSIVESTSMIFRIARIAIFFVMVVALNASALDLLCLIDFLQTGSESTHAHLDGNDTHSSVTQHPSQNEDQTPEQHHGDGMDCQLMSTAGSAVTIVLHLPLEESLQMITGAYPESQAVATYQIEQILDVFNPFHSPPEKPPQALS